MAAPQPIKRSLQLAPISREHHEGLLLVWKIRKGISINIEPQRITHYIMWFWQQHLQTHFEKEEALLPSVLSNEHPLVQQLFKEHEEIKKLLPELEHGDFKKLETFAQTLYDHIRFEERQLFNVVEKEATEAQLNHIETAWAFEKVTAVWDDPFWI